MVDMPENTKMVFSSNVDSIGYDSLKAELFVRYKSGSIYVYANVPAKTADETMNAPSIGDALQPIKKNPQQFPYRRIA